MSSGVEAMWPDDVAIERVESSGALAVMEGAGIEDMLAASDLESATRDVELEAAAAVVVVEAASSAGVSFFVFPLFLNISLGKSATAIVILPMSPIRAEVTAEIGSQGCSSVLYSVDRYLN